MKRTLMQSREIELLCDVSGRGPRKKKMEAAWVHRLRVGAVVDLLVSVNFKGDAERAYFIAVSDTFQALLADFRARGGRIPWGRNGRPAGQQRSGHQGGAKRREHEENREPSPSTWSRKVRNSAVLKEWEFLSEAVC